MSKNLKLVSPTLRHLFPSSKEELIFCFKDMNYTTRVKLPAFSKELTAYKLNKKISATFIREISAMIRKKITYNSRFVLKLHS